mgnify:FL=1
MPVEKVFRRHTPYAFAVEPQLVSTIHRAGVDLGLELSANPAFHWVAEEFLAAPLPPNMACVKGDTIEDTYFYDINTMETSWVHPSAHTFAELATLAVESNLGSFDTVAVKAKEIADGAAEAAAPTAEADAEATVSQVLGSLPEYPHLEGVQLFTPTLLVHLATKMGVDLSPNTPAHRRDLWSLPLLLAYVRDVNGPTLPEGWTAYDEAGARVYFNVESQETSEANPWLAVHRDKIAAAKEQHSAQSAAATATPDTPRVYGEAWVAFGDGNRQVYYHNFRTHATSNLAPKFHDITVSLQKAIRRFLATLHVEREKKLRREHADLARQAREAAAAAARIQASQRSRIAKRIFDLKKHSSVKIQRIVRGRQARFNVHELPQLRHEKARVIQSAVRGGIARKQVKRDRAARDLQRVTRGHRVRQERRKSIVPSINLEDLKGLPIAVKPSPSPSGGVARVGPSDAPWARMARRFFETRKHAVRRLSQAYSSTNSRTTASSASSPSAATASFAASKYSGYSSAAPLLPEATSLTLRRFMGRVTAMYFHGGPSASGNPLAAGGRAEVSIAFEWQDRKVTPEDEALVVKMRAAQNNKQQHQPEGGHHNDELEDFEGPGESGWPGVVTSRGTSFRRFAFLRRWGALGKGWACVRMGPQGSGSTEHTVPISVPASRSDQEAVLQSLLVPSSSSSSSSSSSLPLPLPRPHSRASMSTGADPVAALAASLMRNVERESEAMLQRYQAKITSNVLSLVAGSPPSASVASETARRNNGATGDQSFASRKRGAAGGVGRGSRSGKYAGSLQELLAESRALAQDHDVQNARRFLKGKTHVPRPMRREEKTATGATATSTSTSSRPRARPRSSSSTTRPSAVSSLEPVAQAAGSGDLKTQLVSMLKSSILQGAVEANVFVPLGSPQQSSRRLPSLDPRGSSDGGESKTSRSPHEALGSSSEKVRMCPIWYIRHLTPQCSAKLAPLHVNLARLVNIDAMAPQLKKLYSLGKYGEFMTLALNVLNSNLAMNGPSAQSDRVWTQLVFQCIGFANKLVVQQCRRGGAKKNDKRSGKKGKKGRPAQKAASNQLWNRAIKFLSDAADMAEPADGVLFADEQADRFTTSGQFDEGRRWRAVGEGIRSRLRAHVSAAYAHYHFRRRKLTLALKYCQKAARQFSSPMVPAEYFSAEVAVTPRDRWHAHVARCNAAACLLLLRKVEESEGCLAASVEGMWSGDSDHVESRGGGGDDSGSGGGGGGGQSTPPASAPGSGTNLSTGDRVSFLAVLYHNRASTYAAQRNWGAALRFSAQAVDMCRLYGRSMLEGWEVNMTRLFRRVQDLAAASESRAPAGADASFDSWASTGQHASDSEDGSEADEQEDMDVDTSSDGSAVESDGGAERDDRAASTGGGRNQADEGTAASHEKEGSVAGGDSGTSEGDRDDFGGGRADGGTAAGESLGTGGGADSAHDPAAPEVEEESEVAQAGDANKNSEVAVEAEAEAGRSGGGDDIPAQVSNNPKYNDDVAHRPEARQEGGGANAQRSNASADEERLLSLSESGSAESPWLQKRKEFSGIVESLRE